MIFNADKQTLDDLNIFGKKGKDSVYALFNRTCTTGGAVKLEQIFHYPSTGAAEIRDRSETIQFFCRLFIRLSTGSCMDRSDGGLFIRSR